ncbi:Lactate utilization protein B [Geobacillus sp. BCO2]|nr:Lactate utilization protein B [Geobacillus sp. BCO2]
MPMKIENGPFWKRVKENLQNDFMRGAVAGMQDRGYVRRLASSKSSAIGKSGARLPNKSASIRSKTWTII